MEVCQFHQYLIRLDGSGRQSLCNRKFLRRYTPILTPTVTRSILEDIALIPRPPLLRPADPPGIYSPPPVPTTPTTHPRQLDVAGRSTAPHATSQDHTLAATHASATHHLNRSSHDPTKINQATKATGPASLYYSVLTTPMVSRLGWR